MNPWRWLKEWNCGTTGHDWHPRFRSAWNNERCHWCDKKNPNWVEPLSSQAQNPFSQQYYQNALQQYLVQGQPQQYGQGILNSIGGLGGSFYGVGLGQMLGNAAAPASAEPELSATELPAWRGWLLDEDDDGPVLRPCNWPLLDGPAGHQVFPLSYRDTWLGPVATAHAKPSQTTQVGLYALKSTDDPRFNTSEMPIVGEIALSGHVIEGEKGYRAERAVIRKLVIRESPLPNWSPLLLQDALAERYECEVEVELRAIKPIDEWQQAATAIITQWTAVMPAAAKLLPSPSPTISGLSRFSQEMWSPACE